MAQLHVSKRTLFRNLSLALTVGALMLYIRPHTRQMATPFLLEALLFLVVFGGYVTSRSRFLWAVPCFPAFVYHFIRLVNFMKMGVWSTLYFWEVALLAVSYLLAVVLIGNRYRPPLLRVAVLLLFLICIGFGIWDIIDGWWVIMNHTWTPIGERISMFVFYYIPDTMFWILPFIMLGKVVLDGDRL